MINWDLRTYHLVNKSWQKATDEVKDTLKKHHWTYSELNPKFMVCKRCLAAIQEDKWGSGFAKHVWYYNEIINCDDVVMVRVCK